MFLGWIGLRRPAPTGVQGHAHRHGPVPPGCRLPSPVPLLDGPESDAPSPAASAPPPSLPGLSLCLTPLAVVVLDSSYAPHGVAHGVRELLKLEIAEARE